MRWRIGALACCAGVLAAGASEVSSGRYDREALPQSRECLRTMRKTFEALQAYRRSHQGTYPRTTAAMISAGLVDAGSLVCPCVREGLPSSSGPGGTWSSAGISRDTDLSFQYELSPAPVDPMLLPDGRAATWREIKEAMAMRPGWEDVPVIRCARHSAEGLRLNVTFSSRAYVSGTNWEEEFVESVPYTYRSPYLVVAGSAPPFAGPQRLGVEQALGSIDLGAACNALPADPWWWGNRIGPHGEPAATLEVFARAQQAVMDDLAFDVRHIVQVQGAKVAKQDWKLGFVSRSFPSERMVSIRSRIHEAQVLCATIWRGARGSVVGKLIWEGVSGPIGAVDLVYGENVACFRVDRSEDLKTKAFWRENVPVNETQIFRVKWINPTPEAEVRSLRLVASDESPASPFVIAISTR